MRDKTPMCLSEGVGALGTLPALDGQAPMRSTSTRHPSLRGFRLVIATLMAFVLATCAAPPPPLQYEDRSPVATETSTREVLDPNQLRVRLSAHEGKERLLIRGTAWGEVSLRREGNQLRTSNDELAPSFLLSAPPAGAGLEVGGRFYRGQVFIAPHPAGGLYVENRVDIEDYIAGVVPAELVLWSSKESEIEAQAIAARTYALRSLNKRRLSGQPFLWDDTRDQVYLGVFQSGTSNGALRVAARLRRGLESSSGLILRDPDGDFYDVRFHASCGGFTTSPADAFPFESVWHHEPVRCDPCARIGAEEAAWPADDQRRQRVHWTWTAPPAELIRLSSEVGLGGSVTSLSAPQLDRNQRWQSVELRGPRGSQRITLRDMRRILGAGDLKSGRITKIWPAIGQNISGGVFFEGVGRGHGAGLCQIGSHAYAEAGWSAAQILGHYLPGSRITPLPRPARSASGL